MKRISKDEFRAGRARHLATRLGCTMDEAVRRLAAACDGKKKKPGDGNPKEQIVCHAADPNNCRFHKTGKYANLDKGNWTSQKNGALSAAEIESYLKDFLAEKGIDAVPHVSIATNKDGTPNVDEDGAYKVNLSVDAGKGVDPADVLGEIDDILPNGTEYNGDPDYDAGTAQIIIPGFTVKADEDTEDKNKGQPGGEEASDPAAAQFETALEGLGDSDEEMKISGLDVTAGKTGALTATGKLVNVDADQMDEKLDELCTALKEQGYSAIAEKGKGSAFTLHATPWDKDLADDIEDKDATGAAEPPPDEGKTDEEKTETKAGGGSSTPGEFDVADVLADGIEANGGAYKDPEWGEYDDGTLTLKADPAMKTDEHALEKMLKDAGYANASVYHNEDDDLFEITAGEKTGEKAPAAPAGKSGEPSPADGAGSVVGEIHALLEKAKAFAGDKPGLADAIDELDAHLDDMEHFKQQLDKAVGDKLKAKYQKLLDGAVSDAEKMKSALEKEVGATAKEVAKKADEEATAAEKKIKTFFDDAGLGNSCTSTNDIANGCIKQKGVFGVSFYSHYSNLGEYNVLETVNKSGWHNVYQEAQKCDTAYHDAYKEYITASMSDDAAAKKAAAAKLTQAEQTYLDALKKLKESTLAVNAALHEKTAVKKAAGIGVPESKYHEWKDLLGKTGNSDLEVNVTNTPGMADGKYKIAKGANGTISVAKVDKAGAASGGSEMTDSDGKSWKVPGDMPYGVKMFFMNNPDKESFKGDNGTIWKKTSGGSFTSIQSGGPQAGTPPPDHGDHTLAAYQKKSMPEKAKGAVAQMEKLIKTAKTPEMKQKYEAVLAKFKQHYGLA